MLFGVRGLRAHASRVSARWRFPAHQEQQLLSNRVPDRKEGTKDGVVLIL